MAQNEETITVRVPRGTSAKVRAATGQRISPLVRNLLEGVLRRCEEQARAEGKPSLPTLNASIARKPEA